MLNRIEAEQLIKDLLSAERDLSKWVANSESLSGQLIQAAHDRRQQLLETIISHMAGERAFPRPAMAGPRKSERTQPESMSHIVGIEK